MGRWQRRTLWPWLLCTMVVLLAIHGSKGPFFKLCPIPQRMLLQTIPASPISNVKKEIKSLKLLGSSSFSLLQTSNLDLPAMPPHIKERAPHPMYLAETHSYNAPSPSMVTEGFVQNPPAVLPKSEVLPPTIQPVVPSMQPSSPPDHDSEAEKPAGMRFPVQTPAPDVPVSTAISRAGVPDNSSPVTAPAAQVSPPSIEFPLQTPAKLPEPAVSPTSFTSPAVHGKRGGMPIAAPPKISHLSPSNYSQPKVPAVSPTSSTSPAISRNGYGIPVAAPQKELSSHMSHVNNSQPKALAFPPSFIPSPDNHGDRYGAPVAAPPKEFSSHGSPENHSNQEGSSISPISPMPFISPANHEENNGQPFAAPPKDLSGHSIPVNYPHPKGPAASPLTAMSPANHEKNNGKPVAAPPKDLPSHSTPVNYSHPNGPATSPATAMPPPIYKSYGMPVAAPPKDLSNHSTPVIYSHAKGPAMSPITALSPAIHEHHDIPVGAPPADLSNPSRPVNYSHPKGTATAPLTATPPAVHESYGVPVAPPPKKISSHSSPVNHPHLRGSFPVISPAPHEAEVPSDNTHSPFNYHPQPPAEKVLDSPSPMPAVPSHQFTPGRRIGNPSSAPSPLLPPESNHPALPSKNRPKVHAPPPYAQVPFHSVDSQGAPAPTQSKVVPFTRNKGHVQFPVASPSGSIRQKPMAPQIQPIHALPPPPPSLDCTPITCHDPLTNSRPGSPCTCVWPIKVGLRLSISLFTFFPLVFEFSQEIASGTSMDQSQVRIMGADAANEEPDKTVVLIDLLPFGDKFENSTVFLVYEKFWHKQVFISPSFFVDYQVLYVFYPGLPPSPPTAPGSINVDDGASDNNSRTIHPFAVDVRKKKGEQNRSIVAILALSAVIAFILCVGAVWLGVLKCRAHSHLPQTPRALVHPLAKVSGTGPTMTRSRQTSASASFSSSIRTYAGSAKTFSLAEMEKATNNFDDLRIIGEGGFGLVYEGTLEDGTKVAIKVLKRDDRQGNREFLAEVEMLSRLHHRNLIKLIGICTEEHNCLVYELVPNGSVESHLHGTDKETAPLNWNARLKIALGAARGLAYLHEDSSPRVIHRDFKSSNILLEDDFNPKVSDFGLARTAMGEGNEYISTRVMGTFGYVAPEYAMTGHLLVKSDVYSYGVVLLELLTGRKPVDMLRAPGQENLVTWARPLLTSRDGLESIVDPSLGTDIPFDSLAKVAAIASMCVQPEVDQRPFMGEVVQALKLVCNEGDDHRVSGSCSMEETSTREKEPRISTGWDLGSERVPSEPDIFSLSASFTRDVSGSFRRYSSSGPLRPGSSSQQFGHRARGLTSGSASEHGAFDKGLQAGDHWV